MTRYNAVVAVLWALGFGAAHKVCVFMWRGNILYIGMDMLVFQCKLTNVVTRSRIMKPP